LSVKILCSHNSLTPFHPFCSCIKEYNLDSAIDTFDRTSSVSCFTRLAQESDLSVLVTCSLPPRFLSCYFLFRDNLISYATYTNQFWCLEGSIQQSMYPQSYQCSSFLLSCPTQDDCPTYTLCNRLVSACKDIPST
jgi:hypothetical protein